MRPNRCELPDSGPVVAMRTLEDLFGVWGPVEGNMDAIATLFGEGKDLTALQPGMRALVVFPFALGIRTYIGPAFVRPAFGFRLCRRHIAGRDLEPRGHRRIALRCDGRGFGRDWGTSSLAGMGLHVQPGARTADAREADDVRSCRHHS